MRVIVPAFLLLATACGATEPDLVHLPAGVNALRPTEPTTTSLGRFDPGDVVRRYCGARVCMHYTEDGPNAVRTADLDDSDVPDFVEFTLDVYESAWTHYVETLGFRPPESDADAAVNGGDERLDVYLVDFGGIGSGQFLLDTNCRAEAPHRCSGFIAQDNDFAGYSFLSPEDGSRIVGSHELFHAVQASYRTGLPVTPLEGSAVWATENFDGSLRDFESFLPGFFNEPSRSLTDTITGPVPAFSYGSGIWFRFLEERFDGAVVREWLEAASASPETPWIDVLAAVLEARGENISDSWAEFAHWSFFTGSRAGGTAETFVEASGYPEVQTRVVAAPLNEAIRVFPMSIRPLEFSPIESSNGEIRFSFRQEDDASALGVWEVVQRGSGWTVTALDPLSPTPFDWVGAQQVFLLLYHADPAADTVRPTVCVDNQCQDAADSSPDPEESEGGCHSAPGALLFCLLLRRRRRRRPSRG
ncbi:MAG: MXAN_6640 family putative metalloprotease [Myxococcota bacterium]